MGAAAPLPLTMSALLDTPGRAAEAGRELVRRRADLVPHGRGTLEQHLLGVHAVLGRWGQPERVRLAGLVHSVYSTEAFRVELVGQNERSRLREIVGADAERLAFAFCGCHREVLLTAARHDGGAVQIATRWPGVTVALDRRDLAEVMLIHAANLAEQTASPGGGPGAWLAAASRFLAVARADLEVAPPVLGGGAVVMTIEEETALRRAYRALLPVAVARGGGEGGRPSEVALSSPVGEPLAVAGLRALAAHRAAEARALGERALAAFDAWGTAWDKRLGLARWRELAELLERDGRKRDQELDAASRRAEVVLERARGSPARIWAQLDALHAFAGGPPAAASITPPAPPAPAPEIAADEGHLPPRFAAYLGGLRTNAERPLLQFYPGLRAEPLHNPHDFAIVADLERLAPQIAAEARSFDAGSFQDEAEEIGRTGRWSVLFLLEMGRPNEANLARCPAIRSLLAAHRTLLTSYAGAMYFSCLDPASRVAPHQGPTNLRLRCHLGLEVPERCGMRVGGLSSGWQEGRCVVFDDSFSHEVWNEGDRRRLVLVLDLWHPDLGDDEVALLSGLHRYGAANGSIPQRYWARNEAARLRARAAAAPSGSPAPALTDDPVAAAQRAVAASPGDARLHLALGHELSSARRYPEAEASARAAIALDPALAMAHNNLGWARQQQGDDEGAIAAYENALRIDPSCGRARRNLASLFTTLERFAEALELRRAEVRADPDSAPALGALVGAAMRADQLVLAAEQAERHAAICRGTRWYPVRRADDPELPADVPWARVLTPSKLLHDIEQLEYLQRNGVLGAELTPIIEAYDGVLDTLRPLGPDARVPLLGAAHAQIGHVYNRLVHVRPTARVARALSGGWDAAAVEDEYLARRPSAVVVDGFLADEAIQSLRRFCLESTVWSENRYNHGRLGSMFQEGFNCPLLIQIAEELRAALPRIISARLPARQIWGYKYASTAPKETPHADFAVVNVNFWITPAEANLDPRSGGLLLYDVAAPRDWDFATYNNNAGVKINALLESRRAVPRHIPYGYNRAVIFDSDLFHATPSISFKGGYENRRMNVTVLFGDREGR